MSKKAAPTPYEAEVTQAGVQTLVSGVVGREWPGQFGRCEAGVVTKQQFLPT